jgi:glycosyltransferase involved in cell wall biosynthesis
MPVYNAAGFISRTLDSVLGQTFDDLEVVVIDNASTDETPDIVRRIAAGDPRVRYERNDRNIGIPRNFERAYRRSRGTYFKWHAHDDLLAPTFLERCVEVLDTDPRTVLVAPLARPIEPDGAPLAFDASRNVFVTSYGEALPPANVDHDLGSDRPVDRFRSVLFDLTGPAKARWLFGVARSDRLAQTGSIEPYVGAEGVLLARLCLMGRFYEIPEELFLRVYHPGHAGWHGGRRADWVRMARRYAPDRRVVLFPRASQIPGYARAIAGADIGLSEKLRCSAVLATKIVGVGRRRAAHVVHPSREEGQALLRSGSADRASPPVDPLGSAPEE